MASRNWADRRAASRAKPTSRRGRKRWKESDQRGRGMQATRTSAATGSMRAPDDDEDEEGPMSSPIGLPVFDDAFDRSVSANQAPGLPAPIRAGPRAEGLRCSSRARRMRRASRGSRRRRSRGRGRSKPGADDEDPTAVQDDRGLVKSGADPGCAADVGDTDPGRAGRRGSGRRRAIAGTQRAEEDVRLREHHEPSPREGRVLGVSPMHLGHDLPRNRRGRFVPATAEASFIGEHDPLVLHGGDLSRAGFEEVLGRGPIPAP